MSTPPNPPDSTPPGWNNPNDSGENASPYGQAQSRQPYAQGSSSGYGQSDQSAYGQPTAPPPPGGDSYQQSGSESYQQGYPTPPPYQGSAAYMPPQPRGAADESDLTLPLYGASFMQAVKRFYKKYATFSGRASRSEFWWVALFQGLIGLVFGGVAGALFGVSIYDGIEGVEGSQQLYDDGKYYYEDWTWNPGPMFTVAIVVGAVAVLWSLINLVPNIAITWRRLHDANFAGPFYFLSFTSVGGIVVLVMTFLPSKVEGERFDANTVGQYPPGGYGRPDQYQQGGQYQQPGYGQPDQYGQQTLPDQNDQAGQAGQQPPYGQPNQYGQQPPQY